MDEYSGKKTNDGLIVSRTGSALGLRETANNRDQNAQFCNRIGCSGRPNSMKGAQMSCSEKAKSSRPSFRSSTSGKEIIGSSSRTYPAIRNPKKSFTEPRKKLSSQLDTDSSETSTVQDEPEVSELVPPPGKIQRGVLPESEDAGSSEGASVEVGTSIVASSTKSRRSSRQKCNLDTLTGSSVSLASKRVTPVTHANGSRYGLKNFRCNSISDVIPPGGSASDSNLSKRKDMVKKRICEGESSSSARGKKMTGPLEGHNSNSSNGISISDSRRTRNWPSNRDNSLASVRTPRSLNGYGRVRTTNLGNGSNSLPNESSVIIPQISQPDISIDLSAPISPHQLSLETSLNRPNSYSRPGSSSGSLCGIMAASSSEAGNNRTFNRESFRQYNMDGIAEVLLALERIEQDEELTYEQLLVLESNLFLNGFNFYDQHRDMRLDIDNMSYEELLALEERMGNVSTALTEEVLSKSLRTSVYQSTPSKDAITDCGVDKDDVKCSICQEEYVVGDEVGRLQCEHQFHVVCIHQWLRLKNWCPICKASAAPSPSSSPIPSM